MTEYRHTEGSLIASTYVGVRLSQRFVHKEFVDHSMPGSWAPWLAAEAAYGRILIEGTKNLEFWAAPLVFDGQVRCRMTTTALHPEGAAKPGAGLS